MSGCVMSMLSCVWKMTLFGMYFWDSRFLVVFTFGVFAGVQSCIWLFLITMVLLLDCYGVLNHAMFTNVLVSKCHTWQALKLFDRFALKPSSVKSSLACSLSILLFISVWYWPSVHSILCRKNQRMTPSLLKRSENCLSSMDGVHKTATFFFPSESVN